MDGDLPNTKKVNTPIPIWIFDKFRKWWIGHPPKNPPVVMDDHDLENWKLWWLWVLISRHIQMMMMMMMMMMIQYDTMIMIVMNYNRNDGNWIGVTIPKWPNFWSWWICKFNQIYDDISIISRDIYISYDMIYFQQYDTSVVFSNMWDTAKSQLTDLLRPTVGTGQSSVPPNEGQRNFSCCLLRCHNTMIRRFILKVS